MNRFGNAAGLKVGVFCEYDALPGVGHACGHNLIAEVGIATGLGNDYSWVAVVFEKS